MYRQFVCTSIRVYRDFFFFDSFQIDKQQKIEKHIKKYIGFGVLKKAKERVHAFFKLDRDSHKYITMAYK